MHFSFQSNQRKVLNVLLCHSCLITLIQDFSLKLDFAVLATLSGQQVPTICSSVFASHSAGVSGKRTDMPDFLHECWGSKPRSPCLYNKHSYPLNHLLAAPMSSRGYKAPQLLWGGNRTSRETEGTWVSWGMLGGWCEVSQRLYTSPPLAVPELAL